MSCKGAGSVQLSWMLVAYLILGSSPPPPIDWFARPQAGPHASISCFQSVGFYLVSVVGRGIVVAVGVVVTVGGSGSIAGLAILGISGSACHGASSVTGLVAGAAVTSHSAGSSGHLGITSGVLVAAVPFPEGSFASARGVVVGWRRTVALFALVVTDQQKLQDDGGDQEEAAEVRVNIRVDWLRQLT
jgi:hypothetical protein